MISISVDLPRPLRVSFSVETSERSARMTFNPRREGYGMEGLLVGGHAVNHDTSRWIMPWERFMTPVMCSRSNASTKRS